jgi:hypothetical protein
MEMKVLLEGKKRSSMTDERRRLLESINFRWGEEKGEFSQGVLFGYFRFQGILKIVSRIYLQVRHRGRSVSESCQSSRKR